MPLIIATIRKIRLSLPIRKPHSPLTFIIAIRVCNIIQRKIHTTPSFISLFHNRLYYINMLLLEPSYLLMILTIYEVSFGLTFFYSLAKSGSGIYLLNLGFYNRSYYIWLLLDFVRLCTFDGSRCFQYYCYCYYYYWY